MEIKCTATESLRVLIVRHGKRPYHLADPDLHPEGHVQAKAIAAHLSSISENDPYVAIYSSPFIRALQTAVPVAEALGQTIRVEWGVGELLAHDWLHEEDPLPHLSYVQPSFSQRDDVPQRLLDDTYCSAVRPVYPDCRLLVILLSTAASHYHAAHFES